MTQTRTKTITVGTEGEEAVRDALLHAYETESPVDVTTSSLSLASAHGTIERLDPDRNQIEIRECCHREDSAARYTIPLDSIEAVETEEEITDECELSHVPDPVVCPCCGQDRPATWDGLVDTLNDMFSEGERGLEAAIIDTGGSCYAICVGVEARRATGADPHILLTNGGPLLPDRQEDLAEARAAVNSREGWGRDREVDPSSYPTWEIGFYDGDEGAGEAYGNLSIPVHPNYDEELGKAIAGILRTAERMSR